MPSFDWVKDSYVRIIFVVPSLIICEFKSMYLKSSESASSFEKLEDTLHWGTIHSLRQCTWTIKSREQTSWTNIFFATFVHQNTIIVNELLIFFRAFSRGFVNQLSSVGYLAAWSLRLDTKFVHRPDGTFCWAEGKQKEWFRLSSSLQLIDIFRQASGIIKSTNPTGRYRQLRRIISC